MHEPKSCMASFLNEFFFTKAAQGMPHSYARFKRDPPIIGSAAISENKFMGELHPFTWPGEG